MRPKRWNTVRVALVGLAGGAVVGLLQTMTKPSQDSDIMSANVGRIGGIAIGTALVFAVASGVRNLVVRGE